MPSYRLNQKLQEIATIVDTDLGVAPKENPQPPTVRLGARGIVLNSAGEIALIHKTRKNEYKLPGGGIDEGEDPMAAFI